MAQVSDGDSVDRLTADPVQALVHIASDLETISRGSELKVSRSRRRRARKRRLDDKLDDRLDDHHGLYRKKYKEFLQSFEYVLEDFKDLTDVEQKELFEDMRNFKIKVMCKYSALVASRMAPPSIYATSAGEYSNQVAPQTSSRVAPPTGDSSNLIVNPTTNHQDN